MSAWVQDRRMVGRQILIRSSADELYVARDDMSNSKSRHQSSQSGGSDTLQRTKSQGLLYVRYGHIAGCLCGFAAA